MTRENSAGMVKGLLLRSVEMSKNYDSVIESINIIIKNMEENLQDCRDSLKYSMAGVYESTKESTEQRIKEIEQDIELHKEAIIALQMVASGKLRVI